MTTLTHSTSVEASIGLIPIPSAFFTGIGAWLVGTWMSAVLEGVLLQQTFRYFQIYRSDPWYLKVWVIIVVGSQSAGTALTMHTAYFYLVTNYFNPGVIIAGAAISAKVLPFIGAVTNLAVELFYVRRVYLLGRRHKFFAIFSLLLILTGIAFLIVLGAETFKFNSLQQDTSNGGLGGSSIASPTFMLAADVQLTGVLIFALHTSRSGISRTNKMINMIIVYSVSSGFLICVANLVSIILAAVQPHSVLFTVATMVGGQIYSNSFIVALNTRRLVQRRGDKPTTVMDPSKTDILQGGPGSGTAIGDMELESMAFAGGAISTQLKDSMAHGDSTAVLEFKIGTLSTNGTMPVMDEKAGPVEECPV
ncbi:hypothetical protein BD311DRAFT_863529 [Dichomitus squalens]|uniref:DUF6534 domain-containing protein n=1 Tax=Dichomitus squalens TaxID=114155 RepID=A0A4Q9MUE0_9APHY|nr:hypothetical protein BD311DRAFT_863529 [Dichomitus squalens]